VAGPVLEGPVRAALAAEIVAKGVREVVMPSADVAVMAVNAVVARLPERLGSATVPPCSDEARVIGTHPKTTEL
jgi:hypothetical protein